MSFALVLGVGVAGGVGAIARFLLDGAVSSAAGRGFPLGTLAVNLSGAFVLGAFVGLALSTGAYKLLGLGLIGAYTTFSTWTFETHRLAEEDRMMPAWLNLAVSLALGLLAAWLGRKLGAAL
jgi:CrcB protein